MTAGKADAPAHDLTLAEIGRAMESIDGSARVLIMADNGQLIPVARAEHIECNLVLTPWGPYRGTVAGHAQWPTEAAAELPGNALAAIIGRLDKVIELMEEKR